MRDTVVKINYLKLIIAAAIVALLSVLLADSLKMITEYYEELLFAKVEHFPWTIFILPSIGITLIYFLRKYLFKGRQNKGIKEIYQTLEKRKNSLPAYKIPSHYFNGFLTVIFGGSTGIEVSTVVASAAIGAAAHKRKSIANVYKTELVCAGVAAGVATLFASPLAGFLFAVEVIAKKVTKPILTSCAIAALISWGAIYFTSPHHFFKHAILDWNWQAAPFFLLVSVIGGVLAVYFTKLVIGIKSRFAAIENNFIRVNLGALLIGAAIFFFPQLYGDSYHAIPELFNTATQEPFTITFAGLMIALVLLKPIAASLTLGAGGDGGVFAPSIVAGALLGIFTASFCNHFFGTQLIVINFALVGAAAVLSAAIHAPLTAVFLICSMAPGGYILFLPVLAASFLAKYAAKTLCSYTVYSYDKHQQKLV